jgi:hypothetical protein
MITKQPDASKNIWIQIGELKAVGLNLRARFR